MRIVPTGINPLKSLEAIVRSIRVDSIENLIQAAPIMAFSPDDFGSVQLGFSFSTKLVEVEIEGGPCTVMLIVQKSELLPFWPHLKAAFRLFTSGLRPQASSNDGDE